ncbi:AaceriAER168Cp [[Ashbya] aceris (nom. inval.)]|nr:AaceriAER168Cp [[Ashbya] aceris (nom. inval.)]
MSEIPENSNVSIYSKNEKKARELIQKFSMKPMPGISRVTFRKKNNQIFAIDNPEVYKTQGGNYVVFGEPKVDDFTRRLARAQQQAASAAKDPQSIQADMAAAAAAPAAPAAPAAVAAPEEEEAGQVDESGLDGQDIELVMQQANVSRNKAVKALREHNSDIVNAIMSLSK